MTISEQYARKAADKLAKAERANNPRIAAAYQAMASHLSDLALRAEDPMTAWVLTNPYDRIR